jgi:hypothetical protein
MSEIALVRGQRATQMLAASALTAFLLTVAAGADDAMAATGGIGPVAVGCTAAGVSAPASSRIPLITATSGRDAVPEDDLLPVTLGTALPDLPAGLAVTGAHLTLPIPVDVSNVDLTFSGGTIEATSWDARSGTEIIIHFVSPTPRPAVEAELPAITVSYAFDLGSAGRTVHWPAFTSVTTDVVAADGAAGTVTCRPSTTPPTLLDTALSEPVGLVRRGPITLAQPVADPAPEGTPGHGPSTTTAGGASGAANAGGGPHGAPAGAGPAGPNAPASGARTANPAGAAGATGSNGSDGAGGGAAGETADRAVPGRLTGGEALTQPVNLFLIAAVGLTGFAAAVLFTRRGRT